MAVVQMYILNVRGVDCNALCVMAGESRGGVKGWYVTCCCEHFAYGKLFYTELPCAHYQQKNPLRDQELLNESSRALHEVKTCRATTSAEGPSNRGYLAESKSIILIAVLLTYLPAAHAVFLSIFLSLPKII